MPMKNLWGVSIVPYLLLFFVSAGRGNAQPSAQETSETVTAPSNPSPCSLCHDGATITLPEKELSLKGFEYIQNCAMLDSLIGVLFKNDTELCTLLQGIGALCGCPPTRDDACFLCPGNHVGYPKNEMVFAADQLSGFVPTCEIYDAFLRSESNTSQFCLWNSDTMAAFCGCGVTPIVEDRSVDIIPDDKKCNICSLFGGEVNRDKKLNLKGFPLDTCGGLQDTASTLFANDDRKCVAFSLFGGYCGCALPPSTCTLCRNGSPIPHPDNLIAPNSGNFYGLNPTCAHADAMLPFIIISNPDVPICEYMQQSAGVCGCELQGSVSCGITRCSASSDSFQPDKMINANGFGFGGLSSFFNDPDLAIFFTCRDVLSWFESAPPEYCYLADRYGFLCGCENDYLGADTPTKRAALAWVPRVSGTLSLIGSLYIIADCAKSNVKRQKMLPQLLILMSIFDVFGSVAYIFSTLPIPEYDPDGINEGVLSGPNDLALPAYDSAGGSASVINGPVYGAHGNDITCTAQAFFIQLGYTALWFNFSISVYYMLSIAYNWSERKLHRIRKWIYGAPLLIGFSFALACIPFAGPTYSVCWIPDLDKVIIFGIVPIFSGILLSTFCMGRVCYFVVKQSQASRRWAFGTTARRRGWWSFFQRGGGNVAGGGQQVTSASAKRSVPGTSLQQEVLYQSFYYLGSFYITWGFALIPHFFFRSEVGFTSYWLWILWVTFTPLQGFWNVLVYLRPRWRRWRREAVERRGSLTVPTSSLSITEKFKLDIKRRFTLFWRKSSNDELSNGSFKSSIDVANVNKLPVDYDYEDVDLRSPNIDNNVDMNADFIYEDINAIPASSHDGRDDCTSATPVTKKIDEDLASKDNDKP